MRWTGLVLSFILVLPSGIEAQRPHARGSWGLNPFSMEPYAGIYFDPLVAEGHQVGPLVGIMPGRTAGSLSLLGGVGWRRNEVEQRVVGSASEPDLGGLSSYGVLAPGVTLSHQLSEGAAVRLSFHDYIVDFDEDPEHALVLTFGVRFR